MMIIHHNYFVVAIICFFFSCLQLSVASPGYIIAECDSGLSNRLRVLISHMYLGKVLHNDAHLVMIWDVNDACPGHFLQLFQPLENVTFITNSSRSVFAANALKIYPNSRDGFERTMLTYDVNLIVKRRTWWNTELLYWERLRWIREINERVEAFVSAHSVCNMTAMHIRKTDMEMILAPKQRSSYDRYYRWVSIQPAEEPVFLMTDNPDTQRHFLDKYGTQKIIVYANISSPEAPKSSLTADSAKSTSKPAVILSDRRFTTLEHALIDILVAAHARDLRPAPYSSVSDFVRMINFLHRWKWCGCTFRGC